MEAALRRFHFATCVPEFQADWERLLAKRKIDDELWILEPPPGSIPIWGLALVREGRIIATLVEAVG